MANEVEKKILEEDKDRIKADRDKWITQRKAQRAHLKRMRRRMQLLNLRDDVDTNKTLWKEEIEPGLDKGE